MYAASIADPEGFWREHGQRIDWIKPYSRVKNTSFAPGKVSIEWFGDGTTNVAHELHRPPPRRRAATRSRSSGKATTPSESRRITYRELHAEVCRFANVLKAQGVRKGDAVTIYMPMIPEAAFAMLACARIGAVHSVVFGGFSPDALAGRIAGCGSKIVITADEGLRGGRKVPLKTNVDAAIDKAGIVEQVIVVAPHRRRRAMQAGRDVWYHEAAARVPADCPPRGDGGRGAAVHPLHVGLDRPAQGRAAYDRRLSRLCLDDAPIRLRPARGRHLLVHRRCRLGDGPFLHRLRAARQRRHDA